MNTDNETIKKLTIFYDSKRDIDDLDLISIIFGHDIAKSLEKAKIYNLKQISITSDKDLLQVDGIDERVLLKFRALCKLANKPLRDRKYETPICCPLDVNAFCTDMIMLKQEIMRIFCLDSKNRVIRQVDLFAGSTNQCSIDMKSIFEPLIMSNAAAFILAHNHPSGDCTPSKEDVGVSDRVFLASKAFNVDFLDNMIIGDKYYSFKEHEIGYFNDKQYEHRKTNDFNIYK